MPEIINDLASSFQIAELTGDQRRIVLAGRALPYRPFELSGRQRNSIEWYNGNPHGVMQVYGAKEEPTTIRGAWKDIFLGEVNHPPYATVNGAGIFTARDLAEIVDDVRKKGQEVEVTWLNQARRGLLDLFTQKWHNGHDLEWDIQFSWGSQADGLLSDVPFADNPASDIADVPSQFQSQLDQISSAITGFSTAFDPQYQPVIKSIDKIGAQIQAKSDELGATIIGVASVATVPSDAQRRIVGILDGIKLNAGDMRDALENKVDGARLNLGGSFGSVLADRSTSRQQAMIVNDLQALATSQENKTISALSSDIVTAYQARDGDDLRTASIAEYGTTDNWRALMLYNNLQDDVLVAGQIVICPRILPEISS